MRFIGLGKNLEVAAETDITIEQGDREGLCGIEPEHECHILVVQAIDINPFEPAMGFPCPTRLQVDKCPVLRVEFGCDRARLDDERFLVWSRSDHYRRPIERELGNSMTERIVGPPEAEHIPTNMREVLSDEPWKMFETEESH
jgi:hypothetical protein